MNFREKLRQATMEEFQRGSLEVPLYDWPYFVQSWRKIMGSGQWRDSFGGSLG